MEEVTSYHFCIDIRGVLSWPKKNLKGILTKDDGRLATPEEVRDYLLDRLSEGKRVLPMSDCDNFCYQKGCRGHKTTPSDTERGEK